MSYLLSILKYFFAAILFIVAVIYFAYFQVNSGSDYKFNTYELNFINRDFDIIRNINGLAIIDDNENQSVALAYLHCEDRLFQLNLLTLLSSGNGSQIFGGSFVLHDLIVKSLNLDSIAYDFYQKMSENDRKQLDLYSKTVNFISSEENFYAYELDALKIEKQNFKPHYSIKNLLYVLLISNSKVVNLQNSAEIYTYDSTFLSPRNRQSLSNIVIKRLDSLKYFDLYNFDFKNSYQTTLTEIKDTSNFINFVSVYGKSFIQNTLYPFINGNNELLITIPGISTPIIAIGSQSRMYDFEDIISLKLTLNDYDKLININYIADSIIVNNQIIQFYRAYHNNSIYISEVLNIQSKDLQAFVDVEIDFSKLQNLYNNNKIGKLNSNKIEVSNELVKFETSFASKPNLSRKLLFERLGKDITKASLGEATIFANNTYSPNSELVIGTVKTILDSLNLKSFLVDTLSTWDFIHFENSFFENQFFELIKTLNLYYKVEVSKIGLDSSIKISLTKLTEDFRYNRIESIKRLVSDLQLNFLKTNTIQIPNVISMLENNENLSFRPFGHQNLTIKYFNEKEVSYDKPKHYKGHLLSAYYVSKDSSLYLSMIGGLNSNPTSPYYTNFTDIHFTGGRTKVDLFELDSYLGNVKFKRKK